MFFLHRPEHMKTCNTPLFVYPGNKTTTSIWYSNRPVGEKSIAEITKKQGVSAGISGFVSGHSLRRTAITRLHQAGVSSTIIKELSGHRSNAVDDYKVTSTNQKSHASKVLQGKKGMLKILYLLFIIVGLQHQQDAFLMFKLVYNNF